MKIKIFSVVIMCLFLMVSSPAYNASTIKIITPTTTITSLDAKIYLTLAKGVTIDDILIDLAGQGYAVSQNVQQGNTYVISFSGTKAGLIDVLTYIDNHGGYITEIKVEK